MLSHVLLKHAHINAHSVPVYQVSVTVCSQLKQEGLQREVGDGNCVSQSPAASVQSLDLVYSPQPCLLPHLLSSFHSSFDFVPTSILYLLPFPVVTFPFHAHSAQRAPFLPDDYTRPVSCQLEQRDTDITPEHSSLFTVCGLNI